MTTGYLALTLLLTAAAPAEPVRLTPDNVAEYGFHLKCFVADKPNEVDQVRETPLLRPKGPIVVRLRFGLLQKGPFAISAKDLETITGLCLVVRNGEKVQLSVPLEVKVDPGNVVHLYTHFSTERQFLSETQIVFDHKGAGGQQTFIVPVKEFIEAE